MWSAVTFTERQPETVNELLSLHPFNLRLL